MKFLNAFWKFCRPHTIIGTLISLTAIYAMVCQGNESAHSFILLLALITGITCNIYIVGINQIADRELDKINKPHLPLASGELSVKQATIIVYSSAVICVSIALILSPLLVLIVVLSMGIGWAYSCPPLYWRKHHLPAAVAIAVVRGLLVNCGAYLVYQKLITGTYQIHADILILSVFVLAFSMAIAWFKDLPDVRGDAQYHIKSLAILKGQEFTLKLGKSTVIVAYLFAIAAQVVLSLSMNEMHLTSIILLLGHLVLLLVFIAFATQYKTETTAHIKLFYRLFWYFFFAEYLLTLIAYWV